MSSSRLVDDVQSPDETQTNELTIKKLIQRIKNQKVQEVVLALSTTIEGQITSHVIKKG